MTKKTNPFLRHFMFGEQKFPWFNISPNSFHKCSLLCGFAFAYGMQNPSPSVVTLVLQEDLKELLCRCRSTRSKIYLIHGKFWPRLSVVFAQRPDSNFNSVFTIQAKSRNFQHGFNFCASLDPFFSVVTNRHVLDERIRDKTLHKIVFHWL